VAGLRILLTGAGGFVGTPLARRLAGTQHEVALLALPGDGLERLADVASRFSVLRADLTDYAAVTAQLEAFRPELCIHLAWYVAPADYLSSPENLMMLGASLHLVAELARLGCRRFVGVGTCFEYDTEVGRLDESSPTRPRHLYAACKLALATVLEQLARDGLMSTVWGRLFSLYGPGEAASRLVPAVTTALLKGERVAVTPGAQVRDYLHVEDAAAAVLAVAESDLTGAVNIGAGSDVSIRELVTALAGIIGRPELVDFGGRDYVPGDPMRVSMDNSRLRQATGWQPQFDLASGLAQTVAWWRQQLNG
jgi:UDP-glucuronate decarboxylase